MELDQVTLYYRVRKTVLQMLRARGYIVSDKIMNQTKKEFIEYYEKQNKQITSESVNAIVEKKKYGEGEVVDSVEKLAVFFPDIDKLNTNAIKQIAKKMIQCNTMNSIIILKSASTMAKKEFEDLKPLEIELFQQEELLVNITEHELVPQHSVLSETEKYELLRKYRVKESQLPRIQVEDPIARYYGVKKGQVMKIVRSSETAGKYITYRLAS